MVTQSAIARRVGLDVSSVNKILNRRRGPVFRKETIRKVFQAARELGFNFERLKHEHRRSHERKTASTPVEFSIYKADGTLYDQGRGVIEDLSASGARLGQVWLPSGAVPLDSVEVGFRRKGDEHSRTSPLRGRLVRVCPSNGKTSFGIRFAKPSGKSDA